MTRDFAAFNSLLRTHSPGISIGEDDKGIAAVGIKIEQTYTTSDRHRNQMKPHATTAVWHADAT